MVIFLSQLILFCHYMASYSLIIVYQYNVVFAFCVETNKRIFIIIIIIIITKNENI